jgi:hypothetical protein
LESARLIVQRSADYGGCPSAMTTAVPARRGELNPAEASPEWTSGSGSTNAPVNSRTCGPSALGPHREGRPVPADEPPRARLVERKRHNPDAFLGRASPRHAGTRGVVRRSKGTTSRDRKYDPIAAAPCLGRFTSKPAGRVTVGTKQIAWIDYGHVKPPRLRAGIVACPELFEAASQRLLTYTGRIC